MAKRQTSTVRNALGGAGVQMLTGEACAYSLRVLCDVSEAGRELLADYWGIFDVELAPGWNTAPYSVMLPWASTGPLAVFAMLREWPVVLWNTNTDHVTGCESMPERMIDGVRRYSAKGGPSVGSRNVRQFTGRVR